MESKRKLALRKVQRYKRGIQKPLFKEGLTMQWQKGKGQKD
jgi:hypothetical protein